MKLCLELGILDGLFKNLFVLFCSFATCRFHQMKCICVASHRLTGAAPLQLQMSDVKVAPTQLFKCKTHWDLKLVWTLVLVGKVCNCVLACFVFSPPAAWIAKVAAKPHQDHPSSCYMHFLMWIWPAVGQNEWPTIQTWKNTNLPVSILEKQWWQLQNL